MGSALATAAYNIERPAVGLLNVGAEEIKGNERVKQAAQLLNRSDLNYIGFVEGNDIFSGRVDVVVSDGFVGNVALKTIEGLAKMIGAYIRQEFTRNHFTKLLGGVSSPVLRSLKRRLDPRLYNGASLLGLNGIVIKSHGGADQVSFGNAIRIAMLEAEKQVPKRITRLLESQLMKEQG
jgi:glycerol-3-phosphate acyltransferase PlsX